MKFSTLVSIVQAKAHNLKEDAAYSGSYDDGGASNLLQRLADYKHSLVVKYDLRPSEFHKLNDMDVGEPAELSSIIEDYKLKLAKEMMKDIKL